MANRIEHRLGFFLSASALLLACGQAASAPGGGGDAGGSGGTAGHNAGGDDQGGAGNAGSAGDGNSGGEDSPPDLAMKGVYVKEAIAGEENTLLVLVDEPLSLLVDNGSPQRELWHIRGSRGVVRLARSSGSRFLLDFARHPSGELTLLFSDAQGYYLERLDADGAVLAELDLVDAEIDQDPPAGQGAPNPAIDPLSRDAGRLAATGEDVVVAARTGRHSVIAYGFTLEEQSFEAKWRTLVVPPHGLYGIGLTGGTYDTFGQLAAHTGVHVAVDEAGRAYVAVQHPHTGERSLLKAHERVFGEELVGDADGLDLYVTRLAAAGERLGTTVVGTAEEDELYGLRAIADGAIVTGRTEHWNEAGTGFDALYARVDGASGDVDVHELDVDAGDLAFDAVPLADGSWLVAGVSGYAQNPHGASVSEESRAFARLVLADGTSTALVTPNGKRHNEARTLAQRGDGQWVVGGMVDGPGTHSADSDPTLLTASGSLGALAMPR